MLFETNYSKFLYEIALNPKASLLSNELNICRVGISPCLLEAFFGTHGSTKKKFSSFWLKKTACVVYCEL